MLRNRLAFKGERVHFVAERAGEVVGYTAIERRAEDPDATFRVFVVVPWATEVDVAEVLYERAAAELASLGARRAWFREYASDEPLISFARRKGFEVSEEYLLEGRSLVTLAKDLGGSSLSV
jgi:N-acetylglutamate synthase-like GNAT family acetyltransferase